MNGNDTIESLTAAYLEGRLSPEEAERLLETIERDEQARRTLFEMKNLYDMGRINPLDQRQIEAGWERLVRQTSIRSGENRTAGRTSDRTPLRRMARTALRYAAVALIALSAGFAMSRYVVLHRAAGYNEVAAEAKNHSEVVLSDGTRVTLNASSRLRYPTSFDGSAREVWLDGEAYFDVSRDPRKPFVVHTERQRIRVLGTSFNVMAYDGDTFNIVTLLSGAVQLDVLGTEGSLLESVRMKPFEQCRFDTRTGELTATLLSDEDRNRTWTDGVFRFRDAAVDDRLAAGKILRDRNRRRRFAGLRPLHGRLPSGTENHGSARNPQLREKIHGRTARKRLRAGKKVNRHNPETENLKPLRAMKTS